MQGQFLQIFAHLLFNPAIHAKGLSVFCLSQPFNFFAIYLHLCQFDLYAVEAAAEVYNV